ncbi:bacterial regulatory helix-turn-helix protein, LysR family protein 74 [Achromobacter xylosoxidans A8]|uniref:Bacterial regulatory helix-turn-helix protein, LysR family protein 74 n=1 Tax=Achromobacter xylosoxidans (strain A8) TaxID=762376 RepID=E3HPQ7_ACHXA|nr:LysR family transcriptional regulator [Achromobacter xylosoxidans]ADP15891.1 bacterial regulatory helix-turn-helix protein, LysR family protein 74 [Achromobacter xylosoxidans A8]
MSADPQPQGSSKLLGRLRLKQFELIKGVSEGLSFRQLADQMSLSQPAISKMAREMEDTLGAAVFERRREGVSLTPFGESLTHDARLIVNKLARLESELAELRRNPIRTLRAGAPSYTGMSLLSRPVALIAARHQQAHVEIIDGIAVRLFDMLMAGELDFVIGSLPGRNLRDDEAALLHVEVLYPDELSFVAHPDTIQGGRQVPIEELLQYSWVMPSKDSLVRNALRTALLKLRLPVPPATVESSPPFIGAVVAEQPGFIGLLRSDSAAYLAQRLNLTLLDVSPRIPLPPVAIFRLRDSEPSELAVELFALVRESVQTLFQD